MRHEIRYGPSYSLGIIVLDPGESIQAEAGAMVSMSDTIQMQTSAGGGGVLGGLKRAALGGESFFVNTFTASALGEMTIAPPLPGDMMALEMRGDRKSTRLNSSHANISY